MATSREKVPAYLRETAQGATDNPMAAAGVALLPMVLATLPEDHEVLDQVLLHYAAILLALRSDDADAVHVAWGEAPAAEETAA